MLELKEQIIETQKETISHMNQYQLEEHINVLRESLIFKEIKNPLSGNLSLNNRT
jgi:hypothetical protein